MKNNKGLESVFSIVLVLSVILGNFSLPVFAYDKEGVNLEQVKMEAKTLFDTKGTILNKLDSASKLIGDLFEYSQLIQEENAELGKSKQIEEKKKDYVGGEILVKYKDTKINLDTPSGRAAALNFNKSKSLEKQEDLVQNNISVLKIKDAKTVEQKIAELKNDPNVEYVQPNFQYYPLTVNTNLWGLHNIGQTVNGVSGISDVDIDAPEAWTISEGSENEVIVAVIDSGVAYNHPDLQANMWDGSTCAGLDKNGISIGGGCQHGYDYEDNDKFPLDNNGHGTHIAGTIGAVKNGSGIIGVAPNVKIMAIKSSLTSANAVKGINFAEQNGAEVINASWGTYSTSGEHYDLGLYNAIKDFSGLFIVAAGNAGYNHDDGIDSHKSYPDGFKIATPIGPALDNIIVVAATDQNDNLANEGYWASDFGVTSVDVGAPGVNIYSTEGYRIFDENFEGVTIPGIGTKFTQSGNNTWGTKISTNGLNKAVFGDYANWGNYQSNILSNIDSPAMNLNGKPDSYLNFKVYCDSETGYDGIILYFWNGSSWIDQSAYSGSISSSVAKSLSSFAISDFKFRFTWYADGSISGTGCYVDDIKIVDFASSNESYQYMNGTSMAAPHVAGLAALIQGYNPNLTLAQVKNIILTTGDNLASLSGKTVSGKRINAFNALLASNPAKAITAFNFIDTGSGVIDEENYTIEIEVPSGTDVTSLIPTIVVTGALVSPASGVAQDFTESVIYTVTAADSSTQDYIVTVTVASATTYTISGTIKYYDGIKAIPDVAVILEDDNSTELATTTTDANGVYQFMGVDSGGNYVVRVDKDDDASGLSSADRIKIARHIVGLELFDTIYKTIAGDVNNSGGLTSADRIKIARFIVGLDETLPSEAWKFYSSDTELTPDNYLTDGLIRSYTNLIADSPNQDFIGVKMGDVNNSWDNN